MDREQKTIGIGQHKFVIKTYATAREAQAIQSVYFKGLKVEVAGSAPKINDLDPGVHFEAQAEMIRQMVVSMDGSADNLIERCKDLRSEEYDELVAAVDELVSKKKK